MKKNNDNEVENKGYNELQGEGGGKDNWWWNGKIK
jgi:hypothetical protein